MAEISYLHPLAHGKAPAVVRSSTIHCLLLPVEGASVLLPNASVAEIIPYRLPEPLADAPPWLLGILSWREHRVPMVSLESAMGGEAAAARPTSRIAVLNTLNGSTRTPYIAVLTQAIPQLRLATEDNVVYDAAAALGAHTASVAAQVRLNGEPFVIPDLDDLEQRIERLQQS